MFPKSGPWGRYLLGRAGDERALPYDSRLSSLAPLLGSCDCLDFLRAALGLCKHVLAVVEHLARKPAAFRRALTTPAAATPAGAITWDSTTTRAGPIDPLTA